jgi:hypothetical protein
MRLIVKGRNLTFTNPFIPKRWKLLYFPLKNKSKGEKYMKKMKETLQLSVSWCASASQLLNLFYVNLRLNFLVCLAVATHGYFTSYI